MRVSMKMPRKDGAGGGGRKGDGGERHPGYLVMITEALQSMAGNKGSVAAIKNYMAEQYGARLIDNAHRHYLKTALMKGVEDGILRQLTGMGASGTFKYVGGKGPRREARSAPKPRAKKEKPKSKKMATKSSGNGNRMVESSDDEDEEIFVRDTSSPVPPGRNVKVEKRPFGALPENVKKERIRVSSSVAGVVGGTKKPMAKAKKDTAAAGRSRR